MADLVALAKGAVMASFVLVGFQREHFGKISPHRQDRYKPHYHSMAN
jgi:hypothetical protein